MWNRKARKIAVENHRDFKSFILSHCVNCVYHVIPLRTYSQPYHLLITSLFCLLYDLLYDLAGLIINENLTSFWGLVNRGDFPTVHSFLCMLSGCTGNLPIHRSHWKVTSSSRGKKHLAEKGLETPPPLQRGMGGWVL